jgi:hypothetical protein
MFFDAFGVTPCGKQRSYSNLVWEEVQAADLLQHIDRAVLAFISVAPPGTLAASGGRGPFLNAARVAESEFDSNFVGVAIDFSSEFDR